MIAHAAWDYTKEYPEGLIQKDSVGKPVLYSKSDFEDVYKSIEALYADIFRFEVSNLKAKSDGQLNFPKI